MIIEIMLIILAMMSVIVNTIVSIIIIKDVKEKKQIEKIAQTLKQNKSEVNTNVAQASIQNREGIQNQIHDVR